MNELNDISIVPWPFRHWPESTQITYRWFQNVLVGGHKWLSSVPSISQGHDLNVKPQNTHFQDRFPFMDIICPFEASLLPPFVPFLFILKKLKITLATLEKEVK